MDESNFLETILSNPTDEAPLLVYADWLEELGDSLSTQRAEFLRMTVELSRGQGSNAEQKTARKRLQKLAASLDTRWLAVVSRLRIENCPPKQNELIAEEPAKPFELLCPQRWEALAPTAEGGVRTCEACHQNVFYCDTIVEARRHAEKGHCIAVDLGVIRRDRDLQPEMMMLGFPSPDWMRAEEERMKPDPVSAERERRKNLNRLEP